jgi:o-succinylbenzoate synthase
MPRYHWSKYTLNFKRPSGTSRGVLKTKDSWFLIGTDSDFEYPAMGECSIIEGLSPDPLENYESQLDELCAYLNGEQAEAPILTNYPSIQFGLEMLQADVAVKGSKRLFTDSFTEGRDQMRINGLVWMGEKDWMRSQIEDLIERGFTCIKMKIGAIDFEQELSLLRMIREEYGSSLELRVDANGALAPEDALEKLHRLAAFDLHSIEQPIGVNQWESMADLCAQSPIPIALDEELIGRNPSEFGVLLSQIQPQYIILKPSLIGGWKASSKWIKSAEDLGIGWWMTSALESNIGLNAIAQFTYQQGVKMPQGLGTGSLYTNNLDSPLYIQGQNIGFDPNKNWNLSPINHG